MEIKGIVLQVGNWEVRIYEDFLAAENKEREVFCSSKGEVEVKEKE